MNEQQAQALKVMAGAAAEVILAKLGKTGMTLEQQEAYVKSHQDEIVDFAVRLMIEGHKRLS